MADPVTEEPAGLRYVVSATEIADLFGAMSASTVSNWRARHADFPMPLMRSHNAPFELDDVLAWARRPDTPARLTQSLTSEWWWSKTVDAVRAAVDAPRTGASMNPLRSYLCAVVLVRAALAGDVAGVRGSARRWAALVASSEPGPALDVEASRLEDGHGPLRGLLVEPIRRLRMPPAALAEVLQRLDAAANGGVTWRRLLEVVLDHVSSGVHPKQVVTTTGDDLATIVADLAEVSAGDVVYDPCAGEGSLLLACARAAGGEITSFAQELDMDASRIARTRFLVEPVAVDVGEPGLDSLGEDQFPGRRADVVVADPPVVVRASLSSWVDHVLDHLADGGRAVVSIPAYAITEELREVRRQRDEALQQRLEELIDAGQVRGVAVLTQDVRRDVPGPMTVWVFGSGPTQSGDIRLLTYAGRRAGEIGEPSAANVAPGDLLAAIATQARQLSSGGRRSSPAPKPSGTMADARRQLVALTDELAPVLERVALEDAGAADRVRAALGELSATLDTRK